MEISFDDSDFANKLCEIYKKYGIAIIKGVWSKEECDGYMDDLISCFEKLGTGIDRQDPSTWNIGTIPPNLRPGLFHSLVGHLKPVWELRGDERVRQIFTILYSFLRGKEIKDFVVSFDGINVRPGTIGPYQKDEKKDWTHLDQTGTEKDPLFCVQGQAVLTNTTACLRATPHSYKIYQTVLDLHGIKSDDKKNWLMIKNRYVKPIRDELWKRCQSKDYQQGMVAPAGSFLVWSSSTLHSALLQEGYQAPVFPIDPWLGWRGVVYICYRPREDFSPEELKIHATLFDQNRLTNHWGTKIFDKYEGLRWLNGGRATLHPTLQKLLDSPPLLYELLGKPTLTPSQSALL